MNQRKLHAGKKWRSTFDCGLLRRSFEGRQFTLTGNSRYWIPTRQAVPPEVMLTKSQKLALGLLADGLSMKDIAALHGVSIHTVHSHLRRAYQKLNARGSNNAIAIAIRTGLI